MTHKFDVAKVIRDHTGKSWLCLRVQNAPMARNECIHLKSGLYDAEIKKHFDKRSKKANRYFWMLCGKIAAVTLVPKNEIYRSYIKEIGDNYKFVPVANNEQRKLISSLWESQGIGWVTEDFDADYLICYYGSSTYTTEQMARLINLVVQDCQSQDIPTEPPGSIDEWISDWKPDERTV